MSLSPVPFVVVVISIFCVDLSLTKEMRNNLDMLTNYSPDVSLDNLLFPSEINTMGDDEDFRIKNFLNELDDNNVESRDQQSYTRTALAELVKQGLGFNPLHDAKPEAELGMAEKRGMGMCINNCLRGHSAMNFIRCKSMCH